MLNSEPHKEAMLKVLKHAYVPYNSLVDKIDHLVGNIMMDNYISFSDDEIPLNGRGSIKVLHITTKVKDCTLPKILIDNESSLNAMYVEEGAKVPMPNLSENTHSSIRQVPGKGVRAEKVLGKRL